MPMYSDKGKKMTITVPPSKSLPHVE